MKNMYDCIIIGAGPAGSAAAKTAAEKGLKVLLVEKCRLPRYKSCSGVLIKKSMDLIGLYFGERAPEFTTCTPVENRGMVFTTDKGIEHRFEQEGLNIWRSSFDNWLTEKAAEKGAEIRDCTAAVACEERDGYVTLTLQGDRTYTEQAQYVLDCEGVVGAFKRKITGGRRDYINTFQTFNRGAIDLDPHYFYAYLQPELSGYDAWFNVKDDLLVLGVSAKDAREIPAYYECFLAYMRARHGLRIDEELRTDKWLMPRIRPGCPVEYGIGRVLLAGEVAGFLNPMGEGISGGMESGYLAACALAAHFEDPGKVYTEYRRSTEPLKTYMERQWNLVAAMADTFREMRL